MKKIVMIMFLMFSSYNAFAIVGASGKVSRIYPAGNNMVYFSLKNDACNSTKYYYFSLDSESKKAWFSLILSAANTGGVIIVSLHECPTTSDVEIRYLYQDF